MSGRWWQLKRSRIRAGGFYFSPGFAAQSMQAPDKTAMLRRLGRIELEAIL